MSTLKLTSSNSDVAVEFSDVEDDYWVVSVTACDHSARRRVYMYRHGPGIASLFAEAAKEWQGWKGPKVWESLEGELRLELTSDSLGHVVLAVRVRSDQGISDRWQLDVELGLDAGQLEAIARDADRLARRERSDG